MNQLGKSGEWIEDFRRLWEDGACDRQTTSIRVCLSVDAPFDGRTSGRSVGRSWSVGIESEEEKKSLEI